MDVNFGVCTAEQFLGSFLNGIIDDISSGLDSVMGGISKILDPAFKIVDFLRGSVDVIKSIQDFFSCNQTADKSNGVKEWTIGYGPKNKAKVNDILDNALELANISNALSAITPQTSPFTKPDCGTPTSCGGPTVSFFGGNGIGGAGKALMGGIVNNTDGLGEITSSVARTGSIIGVEITDPGSKYSYAPPMVTFEDSCGLGYGAVGRAIVDYDKNSSTYGQITGVYMVSEGENYPVEDTLEGSVIDTVVLYPGSGYVPGDTAIDDNGEEYDLTIDDNGRVISASPINRLKVTELPTITIITKTGIGALIKPIVRTSPPSQNEIISVSISDPQMNGDGPSIAGFYGYTENKDVDLKLFSESGTFHHHNDKCIEMIAGSKSSAKDVSFILATVNGDITITCMNNGNIKIKGQNIMIQADEDIDLKAGRNVNIIAKNGKTEIRGQEVNADGLTGNLVEATVGSWLQQVTNGTYVGQDFLSSVGAISGIGDLPIVGPAVSSIF